MDTFNCQNTDSANSSGQGTKSIDGTGATLFQAASVQDGGASDKGKKTPDLDAGTERE